MFFFIARILFFRLHESPRYLVHAGRHEEALLNLRKISRFNGDELTLRLADVCDQHTVHPNGSCSDDLNEVDNRDESAVILDGEVDEEHARLLSEAIERVPKKGRRTVASIFSEPESGEGPRTPLPSNLEGGVVHYDSTGSSEVPLDGHSFVTPASEIPPSRSLTFSPVKEPKEEHDTEETNALISNSSDPTSTPVARPRLARSSGQNAPSTMRRRSSLYEAKAKVYWALPRRIRKPLLAWLDKISMVLNDEWRATTLLVWAMWCAMSLGKLIYFKDISFDN